MEASKDLISWDDTPSSTPMDVDQEGMSSCPVCSKLFRYDRLEEHVNYCLNAMEQVDQEDPFDIKADPERDAALKFLEEEEKRRKKKEEEDYRLALQLLADEEKREKEQRGLNYKCPICTKPFEQNQIMSIYFIDKCGHTACKSCLRDLIVSKSKAKKCSEISCPTCKGPFQMFELKELVTKEEFGEYEKSSLEEVISADQSFIRCPNEKCGNVMERIKQEVKAEAAANETDAQGKPLSKEAIQHRNEFRFRCRECQTEFCANCSKTPYHLGFTCEKFEVYNKATHCRYCNVQLTNENFAKDKDRKPKSLKDVCNSKDCLEKRDAACEKTLPCGHNCFGIKGEAACAPCLHEDCVKDGQNHEDYCNICWVESLGGAPSVKLNCGHYFHYSCVKKKIDAKWTGSRITFGFLECALCKQWMKHPSIAKDLEPILKLHKDVEDKGMERLKALNLLKSEELTKPTSRWCNKPKEYALYRFSYFPCFRCKKPYFGGEKVCEGNNDQQFDPKELICGGCSDFAAEANCKIHGADYIEYKCRYCCNVSVWFCFGTTHFCDECHRKAGVIDKVPKNQLPKCNCSMKHPPNGEEFLLGCSMCRLTKFNCFN